LPIIRVDTLFDNLLAFLPESILVIALVLLMLLRLFTVMSRVQLGGLSLAALVVALFAAGVNWAGEPSGDAFNRMLVNDSYTMFVRFILLGAATLTVILTLITGIPDREDSADFHVLLLGGTLGMLLMAASNHLLMVYIAVEMASLPSYA